ncbi:hypothetical protein J1N35_005922 [Gossypium stocksii]|uniref:Methyltransferase type 11 domain-containing protein n=1 Tax=Gossypium stocksii TaxID=47602 RepID=A0A9D4AHK3_9ROSI|nr:hypothetical protein J1N35_005922 [Gossypium stocksii]
MCRWDSEGPFKTLHKMNPTRKDPLSVRPFEGLRFIDVGCGGVILLEPLARMGATVTGIDAVEKNIKIARLHANLDPAASTIEYCCTTALIEHVADAAECCKSLSALAAHEGATVVSTINRSMRSYATAIVAAGYLLQWLPKGTHQWSSFLTQKNSP